VAPTEREGNEARGAAGNRSARFLREREDLQLLLQELAGSNLKRLFSVDHKCYTEGALPARTKELLGLTASLVLRCDDCICYHLIRCREAGWTREELLEAFEVAAVAGGSVTVPHLRRAAALLEELLAESGPRDT